MKIQRRDIAGVAILVACKGVYSIWIAMVQWLWGLKCGAWKEACIAGDGFA